MAPLLIELNFCNYRSVLPISPSAYSWFLWCPLVLVRVVVVLGVVVVVFVVVERIAVGVVEDVKIVLEVVVVLLGCVMVAPVISISSDTSEESVGSHAPRVILFGAIPAIIPAIPEVPVVPADPIVTPEVGTVLVVSPAGVLDLVDYSSSSDSDPSEDSLPPTPDLPLVSPFLCSDDTEADGDVREL
ncbi:hypothetical protein Tco_0662599 [Tanacetum coccineum]